jgi:hypothetical protein
LGLAALAAASCETTLYCHHVLFIPGAEIVLERSEWTPARYDIDVSYNDERGSLRRHRCAAMIEAVDATDTESPLHGEVLRDEEPDDGVASSSATCQPLDSDDANVNLSIDRGLTLNISNDTPRRVQLVVREAGELLLETDVKLKYVSEELNGPGCGGTETAKATVRLP